MITYVDTSMVIKLLVEEPGSDHAGRIWDEADDLVAARLLYVEARSALAAAKRGSRLSAAQHRRTKADLEDLWAQLAIVEITPELVTDAADLSEHDRLRGYDAVHLAAALLAGAHVFATADQDLATAAGRHGLHGANPNDLPAGAGPGPSS